MALLKLELKPIPILIGIGAGLAAALLLMGVQTKSPLAFPLFALSPLPLTIATLSFGPMAGIAAILVGALATFLVDPQFGGTFLALVGLPVGWLAYLAGLAKPASGATGKKEWYPLDRLLTQTALAAAVGTVLAGLVVGFNPDETTAEFTKLLTDTSVGQTMAASEIETYARFYVTVLPYLMASGLTAMMVFSLWAGGRIAGLSGLLERPWTPVWSVRQPAWMAILFAGAAAATLVGGPAGNVAKVIAGASGSVLAMAGFSTFHALTFGRPSRRPLLAAGYVISLGIPLGLLLPALVGIADAFFNFRARLGAKPSTKSS